MPKKVFWPAALVVMGLIFLASNLNLLPKAFWNLWPLILIIVGLGGLLTSDRDQWLGKNKKTTRKKRRKSSGRKKKTKRKKRKK
ncbi:MAG: hypothetical protein GF390_00345 [Candidatus Pacebacteria bacterium]|nr:hypothetical protein [Candidatus Paceibacterota bacterium]